jgi:general secretion pathway protein G
MSSFQQTQMRLRSRNRVPSSQSGMTLLELIIACSILLILASAALPVARFTIVRQREYDLHYDLRQMRDAIDNYKKYADRGMIRTEVGSEGYPPDLDTLVKGVALGGAGAAGKNIRFLRRVPVDPMTGHADWGMRAVQDDPDSDSWGGKNVFDVYSKSTGTALDGTKYKDW